MFLMILFVFPRAAFASQLLRDCSDVPGGNSPAFSFSTIFRSLLRILPVFFDGMMRRIFPVSVITNRHCMNFTPWRSGYIVVFLFSSRPIASIFSRISDRQCCKNSLSWWISTKSSMYRI